MNRFIRVTGLALSAVAALSAHAAQNGPVFPTHHFPTDESFHLSYRLGLITTDSNFIGATSLQALSNNSKYSLTQHYFTPEFQPNRNFSIGGIFTAESGTLTPANGASVSATKLGDQRGFVEYRYYDAPGRSLGAAFMVKFPAYNNPSSTDIANAGVSQAILFGDGQVDLTALATSEFWFASSWRSRLDLGYTYRTDSYAAEFPYMFSVGYVSPRVDLDFRARGNATQGVSAADTNAGFLAVRGAFANSNYALSGDPWHFIGDVVAEYWITPSFGATFNFSYSFAGGDSAHFQEIGLGISFREAEKRVTRKRSFQEVNINTDQESGQFQGEMQEQEQDQENAAPNTKNENN